MSDNTFDNMDMDRYFNDPEYRRQMAKARKDRQGDAELDSGKSPQQASEEHRESKPDTPGKSRSTTKKTGLFTRKTGGSSRRSRWSSGPLRNASDITWKHLFLFSAA